MDVLLVNPPAIPGRTNERALSGGIGVSRKLKPFERPLRDLPPIDLLQLAAVAEQSGARVAIADLLVRQVEPEKLAPQQAWLGVRLSMPSLRQDLAFANRLKRLRPDARVFVFGAAIASSLEHWVTSAELDYVLYGEAEAFFASVLSAPDPRQVPGVLSPREYRPLTGGDLYDRAKVDERRGPWIRAADLSALPRPAWHLLDLRDYGEPGEVAAHVQASRGCSIACSMCPYVLIEGEQWRRNDVARVAGELEALNSLGITRVRFRDANFGLNRKYAVALADEIVSRGIRLSATVETSLEVFDEPALEKLHRAGIRTITTGVETNDAACMASIGQNLRVNDKLRERIAACHRIGFHLYGTFCLGMPEETWDSVERTWRFARELDIESGFTVLTPFPGTPMYWRALEEGLLPRTMQFERWNSFTATVRTYALSTRDLDVARLWARLETILPYRRRRARGLARFYLRHLPHYAARAAVRAYVWLRRRASARASR